MHLPRVPGGVYAELYIPGIPWWYIALPSLGPSCRCWVLPAAVGSSLPLLGPEVMLPLLGPEVMLPLLGPPCCPLLGPPCCPLLGPESSSET